MKKGTYFRCSFYVLNGMKELNFSIDKHLFFFLQYDNIDTLNSEEEVNGMNYNEQRQMPSPYGMGGFPQAQVGHHPHGGYPYGYHHVGYHPYHHHYPYHHHGYQHVIYHPHHHHHGHHYGMPYQGQ